MSKPVRIAVVGVGHLGRHHARKVIASRRADLVALVDLNQERAGEIADELGAPVTLATDLSEIADAVDAVIIAATTSAHEKLAVQSAELGLHALIEKPIAPTPESAQTIIDAMRSAGKILQVGHTERFNPAVQAVLDMQLTPLYVTAERLGPFSGRSFDVDVVLDLMIHDIDIVASMISSDLVEVRAVGLPIITNETDMASARLMFADGTVAELKAGRASMEASRKMRMITRERYVSIDCAAQEVKCVRRDPAPDGGAWPQISGEAVNVSTHDALESQLEDFLDAITAGRQPRVNGDQGLRAVSIARAVQDALDAHSHEHSPQVVSS